MEKKQIDEYILEKMIGEGSFGSVYYTTNIHNKEIYATKVIPKRLLREGRSYEFFKREVEILKKMDHKNINKLFQEKETNNNHYLILEFCNGGDLYKVSSTYKKKFGKPLSEEHVQHYVGQICDALYYLHSQGIIHRDLKLENILVHFKTEKDKQELNIFESTIKLIDFGLARMIDHQNLASSICGSPIIMDPQLLAKMNKDNKGYQYDEKADIWALGTITYELLVGTLPFNASNYDELLNKVNKGFYNIPENIKLSLESIGFLNGLLQHEPKNRLGWKDILNHAFLVKKVKEFTKLDLKKIDQKYKSANDLKLNTQDKNNFLWLLFANDEIKDLSRVTGIQEQKPLVPNNNSQKISSQLNAKQQKQPQSQINNKPLSNNNLHQPYQVANNVQPNNPQLNVQANKNNYIDPKPKDMEHDLERAIKESMISFEQEKKKNIVEEVKEGRENVYKVNPYETPKGEFTVFENKGENNTNFFEPKNFVDMSLIESILT